MSMSILRFALVYSPSTLLVEYKNETGAKFVKKIILKKLAHAKSESVARELRAKYPDLLGPDNVQVAQIVGLIERLKASIDKAKNNNSSSSDNSFNSDISITPSAPTSTSSGPTSDGAAATVRFERQKVPQLTAEADLALLDLNTVSDDLNQRAKQIMDERFQENRLKPGDQGFEWDRQREFQATEDNEWDE
ncbi:CEP19-like protein-domain-containing protein [Ochromonadaceae sp. CCMP2298]|nr:CEP19-like protein-domain-containing protein [Ochromonadaceae sp. CCMP2298]